MIDPLGDPIGLKVEALRELYRRHPSFFMEQQLRIRTKDMRLIPFKPNAIQRRIMAYVVHCLKIGKPIRMIILKARQLGLSTLSQGLVFWKTVLNRNVNALVMAHDTATTEFIFNMAKTFYDNMTPVMRPNRRYSTKRELVFETSDRHRSVAGPGLGSRITVQTAGNVHGGSGQTLQIVHLSELGRYEYPEELRTSIFPAVPNHPGTMIMIESTALGSGSFFHQEWMRAVAGDSPFQPMFAAWHELPEYRLRVLDGEMRDLDPEEQYLQETKGLDLEQLKWRREKIRELGDPHKFRQEFPSTSDEAWIVSGTPVFDVAILSKIYSTLSHPRWIGDLIGDGHFRVQWEHHEELDDYLNVWELPERGLTYDVGVDVGLGVDGGDYSCATVIERYTKRVVAQWHGHIDPFEWAAVLTPIGQFYNMAQIAVEINGIGFATNAKLSENYSNIYRWRHRDEAVPKITRKTGWDTTPQSKRYLVGLARNLMTRGGLEIRSRGLWEELSNFISYGLDSDRYHAGHGYHDDLVISWLLALVAADDEDDRKWKGESRKSTDEVLGEGGDHIRQDVGWAKVLAAPGQAKDFMDL